MDVVPGSTPVVLNGTTVPVIATVPKWTVTQEGWNLIYCSMHIPVSAYCED
jgi:hypothetical protein